MPLVNERHEFLLSSEAPALAEIIIIDNETMNNKKTFPVLSIPRTEIINGAHAKGGTVYRVLLKDQKPFANLFNPINNPSETPIIIPNTNPKNLIKESHICPYGL